MTTLSVYDTTLRDGSQCESISFSTADKLRILQCLDEFGVACVEGGWPGANPKEMAFFEAAHDLELAHTRLAAFGSTCRRQRAAEDDENLQCLLATEAPVCTIFGKSWELHVTDVLQTSLDENLRMIRDSCSFLAAHGREVFFDAEHFFDGYKDDAAVALDTLHQAVAGGATTVVLCDTNGGSLPREVEEITAAACAALPPEVTVGIHTHNDSGLAVANSLAAVNAGSTQVQGTINGIGERCGNADLCSIIPNLELKCGYRCLPEGNLTHMQDVSNFVYDLANMRADDRQPYVGRSAFAHKGGMHVNAMHKNPLTYEHVDAGAVGNSRRILVSDQAGKSNILMKAAEHDIDLQSDGEEVKQILAELKQLEEEGYEYEAAGASFEVLMRKTVEEFRPCFELDGFRVIVEKRGHDEPPISEATVKVVVDGKAELSAAEGDGPVNALDRALRKALARFYPTVEEVELRDYKVRILDAEAGTAAKTRVLIESTDGKRMWGTVGVNENIIEASWQALVDSVEYKLYAERNGKGPSEF